MIGLGQIRDFNFNMFWSKEFLFNKISKNSFKDTSVFLNEIIFITYSINKSKKLK